MPDRDTRLAEIAARAEAATPGPWERTPNGTILGPLHRIYQLAQWVVQLTDLIHDEDAEFIAAARDDVPYLLAEVERLRAERDTAATIASEAVNAATLTSEAHARGILDPVDIITAISRECLDNRAALAEVAARHQPYPLDDRTLCRHCGREWPCLDATAAGETQ